MARYRHQTTPQAPGHLTRTNVYGQVFEDRDIQKPDIEYRNMNDTVIENFKKRSANGEVFVNNMTSNKGSFIANDEYLSITTMNPNGYTENITNEVHRWSNGGLLTTVVGGNFPSVALDTGPAAAKARLDAITSVNKTEVDLGNFVGEWSKTKTLHRDLGNALVKLFTEGAKVSIKRGKFRKTPRYDANGNPILNRKGKPVYIYLSDKDVSKGTNRSIRTKNLANTYLIGRMGIAPLLSDLEGACKILLSPKARRYTARGISSLAGTATSVMTLGDPIGTHLIQLQTTRSWTIRYGILYESTAAGRLAGQLGLTRPLTSAWNLLPWSFVVDWFINVGSFLDAIQPTGAHKTLGSWASTTETIVNVATVDSNFLLNDPNRRHSITWKGQLIKTSTFKSRESWPVNLPPRPSFGEGFTRIRSFDFANLILQRISTKLR